MSTVSGRRLPVYLDHNATAPLKPAVREAIVAALDLVGNPSSVHAQGRAARKVVETARAAVAALVGAGPAGVIFTAGATEANNWVLKAFRDSRRLLISAIEHESVLAAAAGAERVPVRPDGVLDLSALEAMLTASDRPALVSVMLVNNETGVIQPVAEAARLARARGALVHVDAVQAGGRLPLDLTGLGAHFLSLSAHKMGGPKGIGALVMAAGMDLEPLIHGGGQERRRRAGTENLPGIVGFGRAAELAGEDLARQAELAAWRDGMEARLADMVPGVVLYGRNAPRVANTSCVGLTGLPGETQVMALDLAGVAVSAGSACSSGKVRPSHVLRAMGADDHAAAEAIRVSLGWNTRPADIERFIEAWAALVHRHQHDQAPARHGHMPALRAITR